MDIKIHAIIYSINLSKNESMYLKADNLSKDLSREEDPCFAAIELCNGSLPLSSKWIDPILNSVYNFNEVVHIVYVCIVPFHIHLKENTSWELLDNAVVNNINKTFEFNKMISTRGF